MQKTAGTSPEYLGVKDASQLKPGYVGLFRILGGVLNEDGTQSGPEDVLSRPRIMTKLNKSGKTYGFTTKRGGGMERYQL